MTSRTPEGCRRTRSSSLPAERSLVLGWVKAPERRALALSDWSQRPCLVMPISTTSYFLRSMALRMEVAEPQERDFVLAALAAKKDADAEFLFHVCL